MRGAGVRKLWVTSGIIASMAGLVQAEQFSFVGARATGMGGANAASTRDATAQYHNPAAFGFFGRSEWASNSADNGHLSEQGFSYEVLGFGAGYTLTEDLGRHLEILADIDLDTLQNGNLSGDGENVRNLLSVSGIVGSLNSGDALYADSSVGTSVQIGHFGIGLRMFGEGVAYAVPDRDNLSLLGVDLASDINDAAATEGFDGVDYTFTILTSDQQSDLAIRLGDDPDADDAVKYIDLNLQRLADAGDLTGEEISAALATLGEFLPGSGGSIESNQTVVVGRGFLMAEVPVSYGWAMNENLSFGATAKLMYGSVLGTQIWVFDENNDQVLEDLSDNYNSSLNVGIDLGVLYRIPNFQFALVGHNLNRPSFDGFSETVVINGTQRTLNIPDVKIDPQLTFGAAFMPSKRLTLESSLDLLEAGTLLNGYDIQRISFGSEFDLSVVSLRLGAYRNLAASWQDWVGTLGIGANIFGVRAELGGALSLENNVEYDGHEIPSEARLYASFGLDFYEL